MRNRPILPKYPDSTRGRAADRGDLTDKCQKARALRLATEDAFCRWDPRDARSTAQLQALADEACDADHPEVAVFGALRVSAVHRRCDRPAEAIRTTARAARLTGTSGPAEAHLAALMALAALAEELGDVRMALELSAWVVAQANNTGGGALRAPSMGLALAKLGRHPEAWTVLGPLAKGPWQGAGGLTELPADVLPLTARLCAQFEGGRAVRSLLTRLLVESTGSRPDTVLHLECLSLQAEVELSEHQHLRAVGYAERALQALSSAQIGTRRAWRLRQALLVALSEGHERAGQLQLALAALRANAQEPAPGPDVEACSLLRAECAALQQDEDPPQSPQGDHATARSLTPLERALLAGLAAGLTVSDLARQRGRAAGTIRNQLSQAYRKLGAPSRVAAVTIAARMGMFNDEEAHTGPWKRAAGGSETSR